MFTYLETLRSKPEAYRVRIIFIGAAAVTSIIFIIWLFITILTFNSTPIEDSDSKNPSAFSEISANLSSILDNGKARINNIRNSLTPPTEAL